MCHSFDFAFEVMSPQSRTEASMFDDDHPPDDARNDGNHRLSPRVVSVRLIKAVVLSFIYIGAICRLRSGGHNNLGTISTHFTPEVESKNDDCSSERPFVAASGAGEQNRQSLRVLE